VAFTCFSVLVVMAAVRQGWFAPHKRYTIEFMSADGLHPGAAVTLMGLKVGQVDEVEISPNKRIHVDIRVQKKYAAHLTQGAQIRMARPFIIGEKEIMIVPDSEHSEPLADNQIIQGAESLELTDILSGGRMGPYLDTLGSLFAQLKLIVEGSGEEGGANLSSLFQQAFKSLQAVERVAFDLRSIRKDVLVTKDSKRLIHQLANSTENLRKIMDVSQETLPELRNLSKGANNMIPQVAGTLSELVLTLQAMQRSFFLRSAVEDIHEEQAKKAKSEKRKPASDGSN